MKAPTPPTAEITADQLNRAERRELARLERAKPTPRKRWTKASGIRVANYTNTPLTPEERAKVLGITKTARGQMLTAQAGYIDWVALCTAAHRCQAANDIHLVRPPAGLLQHARDVLDTLARDCLRAHITPQTWRPRALRASEIAALDDLLAVYRTVVLECTYGEWRRIEDLSLARVSGAGGDLVQTADTGSIDPSKTLNTCPGGGNGENA
jgi:hypothetical protein